MKTFTFVVGAVAAGKTTFMENRLYNLDKNECNFFDHDKAKLMIHLYAKDKSIVNELNLNKAFESSIDECIKTNKNFMMQIHFTNEQLPQINSYLHKYKNKFVFNAHFIGVDKLETLRDRANKRELLGGHSSQGKSIEKSFLQSFKNFAKYIPKFNKVTIWDNSKPFAFNDMEEQIIFENGSLVFENPNMSEYSKKLLTDSGKWTKIPT